MNEHSIFKFASAVRHSGPGGPVKTEPSIPGFVRDDLNRLAGLMARETAANGAALIRNLQGQHSCLGCTFEACPREERMAALFRRQASRRRKDEAVVKVPAMPFVPGELLLWLTGLAEPPSAESIAAALSLARSAARTANVTRLVVSGQKHDVLGSVLADLINTVLEPMPLADLLGQMATKVAGAVRADAVSIDSYDLGGHRIDRNIWIDPLNPLADELRRRWLRLVDHAVERQTPIEPSLLSFWHEPLLIDDLPNSHLLGSVSTEEKEFYALSNLRTAVLCPLWVRDEFVGLLIIADAYEREYSPEQIGFIGQLSTVVGVAVKGVQLIRDLIESTRRERDSFIESIERLAAAAEARDHFTSDHLKRIQRYSRQIALTMGYPARIAEEIAQASSMHDIGKIAVPDAILLKPAGLTPEERQIMNEHTTEGERLLVGTRLEVAREVARWHHERWDGKGYPDGLRAEEIPISARIVAVADVFDALTTVRPYKTAWPVETACEEILAGSGTAFDPRVVEAFEALWSGGELLAAPEPESDAA